MAEKEIITDIVVVGYGFAGAIAAITAHDAGAEVIILEKMPNFGGCSILAGGGILAVEDPDGAFEFFTALCGGRTGPDVIRAQVDMMADTGNYLKELSLINGAECVIRNRPGVYPFPGRNSLNSYKIASVPDFDGYPWLVSKEGGTTMMKVLVDHVEKRGIPTLTSTAAREILTNSSGEIIGLGADQKGKAMTFKTRKALVLACGGFEHNEWMKLQFLQGKPYHSMAPLGNTGDGIVMASKVGAALWHMWHVHGTYGFKYPEFPLAFRHFADGSREPYEYRPYYFKMPWIVVDKFGRRFMNEYHPAPQDTNHRPLALFDPDLLDYPRIPCHLIFDEAGRKERAVAKPLGVREYAYEWSKDNKREIEKGWIIQADSLEELAKKIHVEAKELRQTVREWNRCVNRGEDTQFRRPGGTMLGPIENPPYYAMESWPTLTNTQGGPQHNARQQVVDYHEIPIPRLYACGELGSMFGHLYELAGNLGECISSGRIAGQFAAEEKAMA